MEGLEESVLGTPLLQTVLSGSKTDLRRKLSRRVWLLIEAPSLRLLSIFDFFFWLYRLNTNCWTPVFPRAMCYIDHPHSINYLLTIYLPGGALCSINPLQSSLQIRPPGLWLWPCGALWYLHLPDFWQLSTVILSRLFQWHHHFYQWSSSYNTLPYSEPCSAEASHHWTSQWCW